LVEVKKDDHISI